MRRLTRRPCPGRRRVVLLSGRARFGSARAIVPSIIQDERRGSVLGAWSLSRPALEADNRWAQGGHDGDVVKRGRKALRWASVSVGVRRIRCLWRLLSQAVPEAVEGRDEGEGAHVKELAEDRVHNDRGVGVVMSFGMARALRWGGWWACAPRHAESGWLPEACGGGSGGVEMLGASDGHGEVPPGRCLAWLRLGVCSGHSLQKAGQGGRRGRREVGSGGRSELCPDMCAHGPDIDKTWCFRRVVLRRM